MSRVICCSLWPTCAPTLTQQAPSCRAHFHSPEGSRSSEDTAEGLAPLGFQERTASRSKWSCQIIPITSVECSSPNETHRAETALFPTSLRVGTPKMQRPSRNRAMAQRKVASAHKDIVRQKLSWNLMKNGACDRQAFPSKTIKGANVDSCFTSRTWMF